MRRNLTLLAAIAAFAGFLFGYDTAVISGCEEQIQKLFNLSGALHGAVASACVWGCVLGAMGGGKITDWLGRRPTLIGCALFYVASAVWSAFAVGPCDLMIARALGGVAVGVSSIAAPVYIAEIAPPERRGMLGGLFQINIITGMIASQLANWWIGSSGLGDAAWRWMLGAMIVPAGLFLIASLLLVESDKWLEMRRTGFAAEAVKVGETAERFFSRRHLMLIFLAVSISAYDQLSGINAVMYFAVRIFKMAGCSDSAAYGVTASMSAISCLGTLAGLFLIDRIGRRKLILIGVSGCVIAHFATALGFLVNGGVLASACVFLYVIFYQLGQGVILWVFLAELFPTRFRAQGQSVGVFVNWTCAALLTMVLPVVFECCPPWSIFAFFGVAMTTMIFWAVFLMPETKGKQLD